MIPKPENIKKILILDFSRIGDTLMHEPALRAVKLHFNHAQIDAITDKTNHDLLRGHPAIRNAKIFPRKINSLRTLFHFLSAIMEIRKQKYDLFINFYMGRITPTIAKYSGIPVRLGFNVNLKFQKSHNLLAKKPSSYSNWIVESNEILRPLGINPSTVWPSVKFFVAEKSRWWAEKFLIKVKPVYLKNVKYAAYQLAASETHKCWAIEKFAVLAERLYREKNFIPVIISAPDQLAKIDDFFGAYPPELPYIRLPVLSLAELAGIFQKMDILISGDTGVMHLGFAVNLPTVCIFANRPEYVVSATPNKMVVFREDADARPYPSGQGRGTINLSVEEVYGSIEALLRLTVLSSLEKENVNLSCDSSTSTSVTPPSASTPNKISSDNGFFNCS